jgi:hypothetical protein
VRLKEGKVTKRKKRRKKEEVGDGRLARPFLYAGNNMPFSKCRVTCAYEAACGSWVTMITVL